MLPMKTITTTLYKMTLLGLTVLVVQMLNKIIDLTLHRKNFQFVLNKKTGVLTPFPNGTDFYLEGTNAAMRMLPT